MEQDHRTWSRLAVQLVDGAQAAETRCLVRLPSLLLRDKAFGRERQLLACHSSVHVCLTGARLASRLK